MATYKQIRPLLLADIKKHCPELFKGKNKISLRSREEFLIFLYDYLKDNHLCIGCEYDARGNGCNNPTKQYQECKKRAYKHLLSTR